MNPTPSPRKTRARLPVPAEAVGQFFRDTAEFISLETEVIPRLLAGKTRSDVVRIWVLGCGTGEEAYSIGILLREQLAGMESAPQVQIFATDLDGGALTEARAGRYPETVAAVVSPERLGRWFWREGSAYCVIKELREMCIFSQHNVIHDPPFSRIDLISCRTLPGHPASEVQEGIIPLFHFALRQDGYLLLGPTAANVERHAQLFMSMGAGQRIFRRLETAIRVVPRFPLTLASGSRLGEVGETNVLDGGPVERLETELRLTRRRLHVTVEQLETTNEALKSSNEEYHATNEQLQSANVALETSKEELQSVNEELQAVNGELAHRLSQLARTHSDLKNLLESTQIATVFLDRELRVKTFTPSFAEIFHLIDTDVGRPITDIASPLLYGELPEDVGKVLRTLDTMEREVTNPGNGSKFLVRVLPYRSIDNFIAGVVLTFLDITARTQADERQKLLMAELQHRVKNILAVVRSVATRTVASSPDLESFAAHFEGRLRALARTQGVLTRSHNGYIDLDEIIREELLSHSANGGEGLDITGPSVPLQERTAEALTLALHELTTNAVKYGALARPKGRIEVRWQFINGADRNRLRLSWIESGVSIIDPAPSRTGFGRDLLERGLAYELSADTCLDFAQGGVRYTIEFDPHTGDS